MLSRRDLLNCSLAGSAALVSGAAAAQAFSIEPMPRDVAAAFALGCGDGGGHGQLMQTARAMLLGEIAEGIKAQGAEEIVVCPLCGCRMVVTATNNP